MSQAFFKNPADFRSWLEKNHNKATELLVGFYKKGSGTPSISWPESVDHPRHRRSAPCRLQQNTTNEQ